MTWTTSHGISIEHPFQAAGKQPKDWDERDKQWFEKYTHLHKQAMRMDMELVALRADNLRLKHENEFMLRLINEKGQHMTTYKTTITSIAVHINDESPIFGESTTTVRIDDDGAGAYIVLEQSGIYDPKPGIVKLNPEELPVILDVAQRLLDQETLASSCAAPAAPQPAQQPLTDEHKAILKECRNKAMRWTLDARPPEAGAFGAIAQDLDYLCAQLGVKND